MAGGEAVAESAGCLPSSPAWESSLPMGSLSAPLHAASAQLPPPAALTWLKWKHTLKSNQTRKKNHLHLSKEVSILRCLWGLRAKLC